MNQSHYIETKRMQIISRYQIDHGRPPPRQSGKYTQTKQFQYKETRTPNPYTPLFPIFHKIIWNARFPPSYGLLRGPVGPFGLTPGESPTGPQGPLGVEIRGDVGPTGPYDTSAWTLDDEISIFTLHPISIGSSEGSAEQIHITGTVQNHHVHANAFLFPHQQLIFEPETDILSMDTFSGTYMIEIPVHITGPFRIHAHSPDISSFSIQLHIKYTNALPSERWVCQFIKIGENAETQIIFAGGIPILPGSISEYTQKLSGIQTMNGEWRIMSIS